VFELKQRIRTYARRSKLKRSLRHGFTPHPQDVYVATYPKSGTTWMQMILYQLTTPGDMSIRHIGDVIPWLDRTIELKREVIDALRPPRLFKTHLPYDWVPPGKRIYVWRAVEDVAVSYFHQMRELHGFGGDIDAFVQKVIIDGINFNGSWFTHFESWFPHRSDADVLCISFHQMKSDLAGVIDRVARFCAIPIPAEKLPEVLRRCTFDFMQQHEALFHPRFELGETQRVARGDSRFFRKGLEGEGVRELTSKSRSIIDARMKKCLARLGVTHAVLE
jgi:hypothetical protein